MWIESHQSLRNHPKVRKAARLAGVNEFEMIGRLHCLWWWALDYAPDGDVTKYSPEDIEAAVDWTGTPYTFYNAMIDCGFNGHCGLLEKTGELVLIHDWSVYGGRLLEKREANAERMREKRATHVQRTTIARAGATEQNSTEQNITEQKRNSKDGAEKAPRPPDALFDALASVSGVDPATAGASIGKVKSALLKANPPYSEQEVQAYGRLWWADPYRKKRGEPPSLWNIQEKIGVVRSNGNAKPENLDDGWER